MDCRDVQKDCQPFLDGELSHEQRIQLKLHLETCRCCAAQYKSQEQFHGLVRRTLVQSSASAVLRGKVAAVFSPPVGTESLPLPRNFESRTRSATSVSDPVYASHHRRVASAAAAIERRAPRPAASLFGVSMTHVMSCAAVVMLTFSGWVALDSTQNRGRCPKVVAAENAHDRLASVPAMLSLGDDPSALTRHVNATLKVLPRFAGIPNLTDCELQAVNCGVIDCDGLPRGVFVKFVECKCGDDPVTLLVYDSEQLPGGKEENGFVTSSSSHHNVVSWKSQKDGLVYVLVTKGLLKHALQVAEVARK